MPRAGRIFEEGRIYHVYNRVGVEQFGVKVTELADILGKSRDGESCWMRWSVERRPHHGGQSSIAVLDTCQNVLCEGGGVVNGGHEDGREGRGRAAKKRAAQAIEALAVRMVETSDAVCRHLPLSDELRDELRFTRSIKARAARKRQIKRLAGLLRQDEETTAAIQAALDAVGRANRAERDAFQRIERLRDALCDPDEFAGAIERAVAEFPGLDRQTIKRLARNVHQTGDKRAFREIFRRLRALAEVADDV